MQSLKMLAVWGGSIVLGLVVGVAVARVTGWETVGQVAFATTMAVSLIAGATAVARQ